ncbi:FMN-binding glutamate synthase family protein, partial [Pseudoalteromonas sp. S4488]
FQIGTAKYGVLYEHCKLSTEKIKAIADNEQVKKFESKKSQGAKPGNGGMLPGPKVTAQITKIRGIPEGHDSISQNGHP